MNAAPKIEIVTSTPGLSAINEAKKKLTIMSGPSVNIGAVAVQSPERKSPESVSLITMVSNGPGLIPSMIARSRPANTDARIRSVSIG